jgi:RNA polymerase sigma factor (TIGR02999 family)
MESSISSLIALAESGDRRAPDVLFQALYSELHKLAHGRLAGSPALTLGTTTLLHEAYLDMAAREALPVDRGRFMAYAARAMRGLVIDHVRHQRAQKRGGQFEITSIATDVADSASQAQELTRISDALGQLAAAEPILAEVVDLKFFCGFSFAEIAEMWGVSERTIQRHWEKARIYLHAALGRPVPPAEQR